MAILNITYNDKISVSTSTLPDENQVLAADMNNIKSVVNNNLLYLPLGATSVTIPTANITSNTTYSSFKMAYRSNLILVTGLTANFFPDGQMAYGNAYSGSYMLETASGGFYVYFENMPSSAFVLSSISFIQQSAVTTG